MSNTSKRVTPAAAAAAAVKRSNASDAHGKAVASNGKAARGTPAATRGPSRRSPQPPAVKSPAPARGATGGKSGKGGRPAAAALANLVDFEAFLAKLGAKDRTNITRHLEICEAAEPDHARLWRRVAQLLATLAPHAAASTGQHTMQFYVADGKYRMQVFALEDLGEQKLLIYLPDTLDAAVKEALFVAPRGNSGDSDENEEGNAPDTHAYEIVGTGGQRLVIESLTASNTPNPSPSYKHMLGWNRKALRVTLPIQATPQQTAALEDLCALAARRWANAAEAGKTVSA